MLRGILKRVGLDPYITNVVQVQPPGNKWEAHKMGDVDLWTGEHRRMLKIYKPKLIITLGNEATDHSGMLESWNGISERRGYLEDTACGRILPTVHPAYVEREWVPWRPLLEWDLMKAKRELDLGCPPFPERKTDVITDIRGAVFGALEKWKSAELLSLDIEIYNEQDLACMGVAMNTSRAFVIPVTEMDLIKKICESDTPKVFQNGMFDRYFLETRCGIKPRNVVHDTMLAWHAIQPELAGGKIKLGKHYSRRTAKSLKFLASIYTRDTWWKDYDFTDDTEMYNLCGKDCCITLEIAQRQIAQLGSSTGG